MIRVIFIIEVLKEHGNKEHCHDRLIASEHLFQLREH